MNLLFLLFFSSTLYSLWELHERQGTRGPPLVGFLESLKGREGENGEENRVEWRE